MQTDANRLKAYIAKQKKAGAKLPSYANKAQPHLTRISAAAMVNRRFLNTPEARQQINQAVQEIGLDVKQGAATARSKKHEEENVELISHYFGWLEERGMKLPEHPTRRGVVFLDQLKVEAGVRHDDIDARRMVKKGCPDNELMKMIESAVTSLGLEVRVLTYRVGEPFEALTYETLLEKGTEERRRELEGKPNAAQQLYNTRSKLKLFCETLDIDLTAQVGHEFVVGCEESSDKVLSGIENVSSRRKFRTEINRWTDYYRRIVKTDSLPENFHEAFRHLVDMSGLTFPVLAKLLGVSGAAVRDWCKGLSTPRTESLTALSRMESLCKLPAGTLVDKLPKHHQRRRITLSQLPEFLKNESRADRVCRHLPDDFLEQPPEKQEEVFKSIRNNIVKQNTPHSARLAELRCLPYRLKELPAAAAEEFKQLASFMTAERPPIGMRRNGRWRVPTSELAWTDFSSFFGALRLPEDAADVRVRGLGIPDDHLTVALVACPFVVDWFIRFRFEARTQYSAFTIRLLWNFMSMLRAETGWLRQMPQLADRLRPIKSGQTTLLSPELIRRARADWDGVCQEAIEYYRYLCHELKPLIHVARDPFLPLEGIVEMEDPTKAFELLLQEMKAELPSRQMQPVRYHTTIRNLALVSFIAATGFRAKTIEQLDFTGDEAGHLILADEWILLDVPRSFFKNPESPYFGPKNARVDYSNAIPNIFWIVDIFKEYLNVSRPFLLNAIDPRCKERPLFVGSPIGGSVRMLTRTMSDVYRRAGESHLAENKWRGTGIRDVLSSGMHSARHIRGTAAVKKTGSFKFAGDVNQQSGRTAEIFYARFGTKDRNRRVNDILFGDKVKQPSAFL